MRWWGWLLVAVTVAGFATGGLVFYTAHHLEVEQVSDDLYVLYGAGGNVGVLRTGEGTVVVDTMTLQYQGSRIMEMAAELTGEPVAMIINTHYHLDHTHGNPAFPAGTRVVSTDRTLHHLKTLDAAYFSGDAAALLPNETFSSERRIAIGDKHITLLWPGRGHTDGDLVALFEEEGVIHMGDLHFNGHYPNIDLEAGASVQAWGATIDRALELDFDRVIPGHGPVTDPEGLRQFQRFINQLASLGREAVAEGITKEAFINTDALTEDEGYTEIRMLVSLGLTREFVLGRAWEEAQALATAGRDAR